jgi:hypothetical protein
MTLLSGNPFDGSMGGGKKVLNHVYPHHFEVPMPDADPLSGFKMNRGKIMRWTVDEGDEIEAGTTLFDIEVIDGAYGSDSRSFCSFNDPTIFFIMILPYPSLGTQRSKNWSIKSRQDGYVARRLAKEGEALPAGYPVALIVEDDFDVEHFSDFVAPDVTEWQTEDGEDFDARGGRLKEKLLAPQLKEKARFKWLAVALE